MYSKPTETPDFKRFTDSDFENQVKSTHHWSNLTDLQKKIAYFHFLYPEKSKKDIAGLVECDVKTVYNFFSTVAYDNLSRIVAKQELGQLTQLALKRYKEILEKGSDKIAAGIAQRILESEGILRDEPQKVQDKELRVTWGQVGGTNEHPDTLPTP